MKRKLLMMGLLTVVSVGMACAASASGATQQIFGQDQEKVIPVEVTRGGICDKEGNILGQPPIGEETKEKALEIAMGDSRVQEILEELDNYETDVGRAYEQWEIVKRGNEIELAPKEGLMIVSISVSKETDEYFSYKQWDVTVDLSEEKVTEIEEFPETHKPKKPSNPPTGDESDEYTTTPSEPSDNTVPPDDNERPKPENVETVER